MMRDARGVTLIELTLAVALVAVLLGLSLPALTAGGEAVEVLGAARYLAGEVARARAVAVRRGTAVGLRFVPEDDDFRVQAYADGNGNGVRRTDVARGIDEPVDEPFRLREHFPGVRVARNAAVPSVGREAAGTGDAGAVRLGTGGTLTMSPLGTATGGTIYLLGRGGRQAAVRVLAATGRVRVLTFDAGTGEWRSR